MGNSTSAAAAGSPSQDKSSVVISRVFPSSADYRLYVTPQSYVFFENSRPDAAANTTIAICLPGIGDTRRQFRLLAPLLHDRLGFRVLVGDLRGFGDSASFEDNEEDDYSTYSPEAIASDVAKLMKELKSADPSCSFVLLGNSLSAGAMVLVAATAKKADADFCIRSLVLLGPMLRDYPIEQWFRPLTYLLFRPLYGAWVWGVYYRTLYPGKVPDDFESELDMLKTHISTRKEGIVNVAGFFRAGRVNGPLPLVISRGFRICRCSRSSVGRIQTSSIWMGS